MDFDKYIIDNFNYLYNLPIEQLFDIAMVECKRFSKSRIDMVHTILAYRIKVYNDRVLRLKKHRKKLKHSNMFK